MGHDDWSEWIQHREWSTPVPLEHARPPIDAGVYMVQATSRGRPRRIARAADVDHDGVLVIGESRHLARRIATMVKAMRLQDRSRSYSHRAGLDYSRGHGWHYGRCFALPDLVIRWWATKHHKLLEAGLLEKYRWRFLDRPPLNASIGAAGKAKRDDEGWLVLTAFGRGR